VIAGWLSLLFGAKTLLLISTIVSSLVTILSPAAAKFHYAALMVVRVIIGMCSGCLSSSINVFLASWCTPADRTTLVSISNSGALMGSVRDLQKSS
jgi:MFS family permease